MKKRTIPNTDLEVSEFCLGAGGFGVDFKRESVDRLVEAFVEKGGNFFDTAHCYEFWLPNGLGASERELAASLRRLGKIDQVVIATKGGHPDGGKDYPRPDDFLSEALLSSDIDESLNRLQIESIPLYYLHRDDGRTPVGEIMERLNRQIDRKRIRYLGASNWSVRRIAEANAYAATHGLRGFVVSQIQASLAAPNWKPHEEPTIRRLTDEERSWHAGNSIPIVAYSATAGGYFADKPSSDDLYDNEASSARRENAKRLALSTGATPTQVALSWLMHQPCLIVPLFSTRCVEHLLEALGASELSLTAEQMHGLTTA